ncbi:unnamed protein product, partial [marine sediment metagenome]
AELILEFTDNIITGDNEVNLDFTNISGGSLVHFAQNFGTDNFDCTTIFAGTIAFISNISGCTNPTASANIWAVP